MTTRTFLIICVFFSLYSLQCFAQKKYALLIGINNYINPDSNKVGVRPPRGIKNLNGPVNDVKAMQSLLVSKFGFEISNTQTLLNFDARRNAILNALNEQQKKCDAGDVFFFFYSGHGSQLKNVFSLEPDSMDETICPADAAYPGKDIRDKDIALIFQKFIDKKVMVTGVFDCCHSGSIARGTDDEYKKMEPGDDVLHDNNIYPQPENNGALILSASQDYQSSVSTKWSDGNYMGVFTRALIDVVSFQSANLPANEMMEAVKARIKYYNQSQIPVIAGITERLKKNLIGVDLAQQYNTVAIEKINTDNSLELFGGILMGLDTGALIESMDGKIKASVKYTKGIDNSTAKITNGNSSVLKAGMLMKITRPVVAGKQPLQLYINVCNDNRQLFLSNIKKMNNLISQLNMQVVSERSLNPYYLLYYKNKKWILNVNGTDTICGKQIAASNLEKMLIAGKTIMVELPLYKELGEHIVTLLRNQYAGIQINSTATGDYFISGKLTNDNLYYRLQQFNNYDTLSAYPIASNYYITDSLNENTTTKKICEAARKINRIKMWLTVMPLANDNSFPYTLKLKNTTNQKVLNGETVRKGESYKIILEKDKSFTSDSIPKRWIYVFDLNSDGSITLLFPDRGENIENHLPYTDNAMDIEPMAPAFDVTPPYGTDNLIMLASEEPLTNPGCIVQEGVQTRGIATTSLDKLVNDINISTRGISHTNSNAVWNIQKLTLKSVEK